MTFKFDTAIDVIKFSLYMLITFELPSNIMSQLELWECSMHVSALKYFRDAKINEASQVEVPAVSILCMVHLLGENQGTFIIW